MREQIQARLDVLKAELAAGQVRLRELELQQLRLREVLLRLRGGIHALQELLGQNKGQGPVPPGGSPAAEHDHSDQHGTPEQEGGPGTEGGGPP